MQVFDPYIFRKCLGWKDISGDFKFSQGHEEHFLIQPSEHLMPDIVPRKARCKPCEAEFKRYQTLIRVKRYRINRRQTEVLREYICAYKAALSGEINLPPNILKDLRKAIIENGGAIAQEENKCKDDAG